jgi:membrane peptidoglycan carboxypeptidase
MKLRFSRTSFSNRWKKTPRLFKIAGLTVSIAGIVGLGILLSFLQELPSPAQLGSNEDLSVSTQILDRNGELLYEIFADENRTPIELESLPPYVAQATIAIEDKNFYRHFGLDFIGIARALINNARGGGLQGGSTLTQQLVKISLLSQERTWERKAKEAVLTVATEARYSKDDILEMYLNYVPYGGTAWGIEAAAQTFFDKSAKDLTLGEAAYLSGLPQSPSRYSPFGNSPELGIQRQKEVLRRMAEDGFITDEEAEAAANEPLTFAVNQFTIKAPHFVLYIRDQLVEEYGQAMVERGGLRVRTTLDYNLQQVVQASVSAEIDTLQRLRVGNGAAVVTRPSTGEILAMVGSRDYFNATAEGKINMTVRQRQPGSSIKPLNLAVALQLRKVTLGTMLLDIPTCFALVGQTPYCPRNYDGSFRGPILMRQALANSYNIPAVKIMALNTTHEFIRVARALGLVTLGDAQNYGISLGLGAGEVRMVDMATAFGVMANQGVKVPLNGVQKIEDYTGKTLYESDPKARREERDKQLFLSPKTSAEERPQPDFRVSEDKDDIYRVMDPEVAWLVSHVMRDNDARAAAFGTRSQLFIPGHEVAVKTGTTNDLRDNWTIGYTPEYLTAVWVGNNNNAEMSAVVSGVTGAAPIWNDIMRYLLNEYHGGTTTQWPDKPETIVQVPICAQYGGLVQDGCTPTNEFFWQGTEPQEPVSLRHNTWIVEQTGLPAREGDPTDQLRLEERLLLTDPFTRDYCLDCERIPLPTFDENGQPRTDEAGNPVLEPIPERYTVTAERLFEAAQGGGWGLSEQEVQERTRQDQPNQ